MERSEPFYEAATEFLMWFSWISWFKGGTLFQQRS